MGFKTKLKSLDKNNLHNTSDLGVLSKLLPGLIESDIANLALDSLVALCDASLTSGIDLTSNQVIIIISSSGSGWLFCNNFLFDKSKLIKLGLFINYMMLFKIN